MGWNYLFIHQLQWCNHWSLEMDKYFHPTFYNGCNYLFMLGLMLYQVSMMGYSYNSTKHHTKCWQCCANDWLFPKCNTQLLLSLYNGITVSTLLLVFAMSTMQSVIGLGGALNKHEYNWPGTTMKGVTCFLLPCMFWFIKLSLWWQVYGAIMVYTEQCYRNYLDLNVTSCMVSSILYLIVIYIF